MESATPKPNLLPHEEVAFKNYFENKDGINAARKRLLFTQPYDEFRGVMAEEILTRDARQLLLHREENRQQPNFKTSGGGSIQEPHVALWKKIKITVDELLAREFLSSVGYLEGMHFISSAELENALRHLRRPPDFVSSSGFKLANLGSDSTELQSFGLPDMTVLSSAGRVTRLIDSYPRFRADIVDFNPYVDRRHKLLKTVYTAAARDTMLAAIINVMRNRDAKSYIRYGSKVTTQAIIIRGIVSTDLDGFQSIYGMAASANYIHANVVRELTLKGLAGAEDRVKMSWRESFKEWQSKSVGLS